MTGELHLHPDICVGCGVVLRLIRLHACGDLFEPPLAWVEGKPAPKFKKVTGWVNVYASRPGVSMLFSTSHAWSTRNTRHGTG